MVIWLVFLNIFLYKMKNNTTSFLFKNTNNWILGIGVFFSLIQFAVNRSMWSDEVFVALNIMSRDFKMLLKPLDYNAVAPILFLQLEKIATEILPNSEYGFRIIPLLSYWLSIYFFLKILRLYFKNASVIAICFAMFTFNSTLIYYSSETKQYMLDVLSLTSMNYFILSESYTSSKRIFILVILGIILIFLSNVAPVILFCTGIYLLYANYKNQKIKLKYLLGIYSIWLLFYFGYYISFIYDHPSKSAMLRHWQESNSFMPINLCLDELYRFYILKLGGIAKSLFNYGYIGIFFIIILLMVGITKVINDKLKRWILLLLPIIIHLILSALKLYPFETRLILYLLPCIIITIGFGLINILDKSRIANKYEKQLIIIISLLFLGIFLKSGIKETHNIKASIKFIEKHKQSRDLIYVSALAKLPLEFYQKIGFTQIKGDYLIFGERTIYWNGANWDFDQNKFKNELGRLSGPVWFLFTDVGDEIYKIKFLNQYCGIKKVKLKYSFVNNGSYAYLYDFF